MTELRRRFLDDMTLHGLAPTTHKVYVNAVERLAAYYHRSPDRLTEQELRDYFTCLVQKKQIAQSTLKTYIFAIKFLFTKTLQKPWPTLKLLRPRKREKLPVVLDPEEATRLLAVDRSPVARMCATVMYSCGLRISEALHLKVSDIDSQRMVLIIRQGKGNKDRQVPLPQRTLQLLQVLLGHRSLKTTTVYLHLTSSVMRPVQETINELMATL